MTTDAPGLREAAEQIKSLVESPNIVDNIQRWYAIAPHADKLSKHYLATHPSDGGEAISEEWLREIGWTRVQLRLEMGVDGRTIELYDCVIADSPMRGLLVIFFKKNTKSIYNSLAVSDNCIYHSSIAVNVTATNSNAGDSARGNDK